MKYNYSVAVLLNGDVWGIWTLEKEPTPAEQLQLRKMVNETLKALKADSRDRYVVQFNSNIECDSFSEVMEGIKGSLENQIDNFDD